MATNDGGPAFPVDGFPGDNFFPPVKPHKGMTLRDWFAGQALVGILAGSDLRVAPDVSVGAAWKYADSMLAAREGGAK